MATAHLEVKVDSSGVRSASKDLRELTGYSKETEKQNKRLADVFGEIAAAEEKEAKKAIAAANAKVQAAKDAADKVAQSEEKRAAQAARLAQREDERWNDLKQKSLARYEVQAAAAEKASQRQMAATERAAKREDERWNNAIQRAKAGLDGVLPIRPSLQRIEAKINEAPAHAESGFSGILAGGKEGAISALGLGALAGGAAAAAAAAVGAVASFATLSKVIAETSAYDGLIARLAGVTGGTEAAREQFDKLEKLSDKTIYTENQVTEAFIRMEQNGLKPTEATLTAFANIASATGTSIEQLAEASLAASLGNYKGLRQFGVKAVQEGEGIKVTFKGVTSTIGNSADAITQYLVGIGETDFAGAAERQLDTMGGAVKKLEDAWGDMFREVGRSAVGDFIKTGMTEAAKAINLATDALEAFLYTASQKPKFTGMSAELAAFAKGASKWGAAQSDEEASLADKVQAAIDHLNTGMQSTKDKELAAYRAREAVLKDALVQGVPGDIGAALDENKRQYEESVNGAGAGTKTKKAARTMKKDFDYADLAYRNGQAANAAFLQEVADYEAAQAAEYEALKVTLANKEEAAKASYEKQRRTLEANIGAEGQEELFAANEAAWQAHLDKITADIDEAAEKSAEKQLAMQRKLESIGIGPQSQLQLINSKTAGDRHELGAALADNLSGKNGEALKLEAERTYAQKSIDIEKQRTEEIKKLNMELAAQSVQNAGAMFGSLATVMKNAHGEQSKEYQTMFAIQKGFGIAAAEIAMFQSMAEASKQPYPANIPLYLKAAAQGADIIAQISSTSFSGSYDSGGTINSGSTGEVGERRPELLMVHGRSRVQGPATVIGGEATAALLGGGKSAAPSFDIHLHDNINSAFDHYMSSTRGKQAINLHIKRNGPLIRSITR